VVAFWPRERQLLQERASYPTFI